MKSRFLIVAFIAAVFMLVNIQIANAELVILTDKDVYKTGEPIYIRHKVVNTTAEPMIFINNGTMATYALKRLVPEEGDIVDPLVFHEFSVKLNGETRLVHFIAVSVGRNDYDEHSINPFSSDTFIQSWSGFDIPFNLLQGYHYNSPLSSIRLINEEGSLDLQEGDIVEILTPGIYELRIHLNVDSLYEAPSYNMKDAKLITIEGSEPPPPPEVYEMMMK